MAKLDNRLEALDAGQVQGVIRVDDSVKLKAPTTTSLPAQLYAQLTAGVVIIAPKAQQFNEQVDIACGAGAVIVDGESLPYAIVAAYNPAINAIITIAVEGTGHATPGTGQESRPYYPTEADILAALPADVDPVRGWTLYGVEVFARVGAGATQHSDHAVRSWGLIAGEQHPPVSGTAPNDERLTSADQF